MIMKITWLALHYFKILEHAHRKKNLSFQLKLKKLEKVIKAGCHRMPRNSFIRARGQVSRPS